MSTPRPENPIPDNPYVVEPAATAWVGGLATGIEWARDDERAKRTAEIVTMLRDEAVATGSGHRHVPDDQAGLLAVGLRLAADLTELKFADRLETSR